MATYGTFDSTLLARGSFTSEIYYRGWFDKTFADQAAIENQQIVVTESQLDAATLTTVNEPLSVTETITDQGATSSAETITVTDAQSESGNLSGAETVAVTDAQTEAGAITQAQTIAVADANSSSGSQSINEGVVVTEGVSFIVTFINAENPAVADAMVFSGLLVTVNQGIAVTDAESHAEAGPTPFSQDELVSISEEQSFAALFTNGDSVVIADGVIQLGRIDGTESIAVSDSNDWQLVPPLITAIPPTYFITSTGRYFVGVTTGIKDVDVSSGRKSIVTMEGN